MSKKNIIKKTIKENNGYLFIEEANDIGVSRTYLSDYITKENLEKVDNGIYILPNIWPDNLYILNKKNKRVIFSHETALMLHKLTECEIYQISVTVPKTYNATHLRKNGCIVYHNDDVLYNLGVITISTSYNNDVKVYDMERTICDIIKHKNKIEIGIFTNAVREYVKRKDKNITKLLEYAEIMKIKNKVLSYLEVLLWYIIIVIN